MPAPHHSFFTGGCSSCHPTNSVKALKARQLHWQMKTSSVGRNRRREKQTFLLCFAMVSDSYTDRNHSKTVKKVYFPRLSFYPTDDICSSITRQSRIWGSRLHPRVGNLAAPSGKSRWITRYINDCKPVPVVHSPIMWKHDNTHKAGST